MAKQALGPDTIPEGVSVDLDEVRLAAVFSWKGGELELDLPTVARIASREDAQLRDALSAQGTALGDVGICPVRVKLSSEGSPEVCELSLAAWATALRHLEKRLAEAVGKNLGEFLQERTV